MAKRRDELAAVMQHLTAKQTTLAQVDRNLRIAADALAPLVDKPYSDVSTLAAIALIAIAVQGARSGIEELRQRELL